MRLVLVILVFMSVLGSSVVVPVASVNGGVSSIVRLPYSFSSATILRDGTIVGITDGRAIFVRGVNIFKSIPLIGGGGVVKSYPPDNPTVAVVYTSAGDILVSDSTGKILYRAMVGSGRLLKATYSFGIVYMLVDTPRGKELYAYDIDSRTWGYVSPIEQNITNSRRILLGTVQDMVSSESGVVVIYDPVLPPGIEDYIRIPVIIVDSKGMPVDVAEIIAYYKDYDFSYQTRVHGSASLYIPIPVGSLDIYVNYNRTWYLYEFKPSDITENGLFISVPGDKIVPPPTSLANHYGVLIEGLSVKYVEKVGPASTILACYGSKIALYDSTYSTIEFVDLQTGSRLSMGLDSTVISSAIHGDILAVLTSAGTLYIFNMNIRSLLSTYSIPGGTFVGVSKHYVFVKTHNLIHMISLKSLKDVLIYETAGLAVNSPYLYVAPDDTFMVSTGDSTLVVRGINATEPFPFNKYVPYTVKLAVYDPWSHPVGNATVFVDGVYTGRTSNNGSITFSLNAGTHDVIIDPPEGFSNVTTTRVKLNVTGDKNVKVILTRTIYRLTIHLFDPFYKVLTEPVDLIISHGNVTVLRERVKSNPVLSTWVRPGSYTITISPVKITSLYDNESVTINVEDDQTINITLKFVYYPVKLLVIDSSNGEPVKAPVLVCSELGCIKNTTIMLFKGRHKLLVKPLVFYNSTNLFKETEFFVDVPVDKPVIVMAERSYFLVNLVFIDDINKRIVRTPLTVTIGGIKYENKRNLTLLLPKGKILVTVDGNNFYKGFSKTINISRDGSYNITVPRKEKTLVIKVSSVVGSVHNGIVFIKSASGIKKVVPVPPKGEVSITLPLDWYTLKFESNLYSSKTLTFNLATEDTIVILTKPTLKGFFVLYSNIILASIGVVVATGILYWMTRRTVSRIRSIKEISELLGEEYTEEEEDENE